MKSRRNVLRLLGTGSAATAGLIAAGSPASAVDAPPHGPDVEVDETRSGFVTVETTVETSPGDAVPIGGQEQKGYLEADSGIYLQGNQATGDSTDDPDLLVLADGKSFLPLGAGQRRPVIGGRGSITTGTTSFVGSFDSEIEVSTEATGIGLHVDGDRVVRAEPGETRSVERDVEITYSSEAGDRSGFETTLTVTLDHMGERRIVSHPTNRVVPEDHRQRMYAKRALAAQRGGSRIDRERVQHDGRNYVKTANGVARVVPVPGTKSFVIEKVLADEISGGDR